MQPPWMSGSAAPPKIEIKIHNNLLCILPEMSLNFDDIPVYTNCSKTFFVNQDFMYIILFCNFDVSFQPIYVDSAILVLNFFLVLVFISFFPNHLKKFFTYIHHSSFYLVFVLSFSFLYYFRFFLCCMAHKASR
jgi:hypothetical protein